jgi:hypothetical protein
MATLLPQPPDESLPEAGLLQTWQFQPTPAAPGLSYSIKEADADAVPVWRLDLPADPEAAQATLSQRQKLLLTSQIALADVPVRIDNLVQHARATGGVGLSFAPLSAEALPDPEADALGLLHALELPAVGVSFAAGSEEQHGLEQAFTRFKADMDNLMRLVTHFAWVETQQDNHLIGRTIVGWSGDLDMLWRLGLAPQGYELHQRSLSQALASRNILLHATVVTVRSAAKLAVLLTTPGGALLAIPVAWKFVKEVMVDVEKYKLIAQTPI